MKHLARGGGKDPRFLKEESKKAIKEKSLAEHVLGTLGSLEAACTFALK